MKSLERYERLLSLPLAVCSTPIRASLLPGTERMVELLRWSVARRILELDRMECCLVHAMLLPASIQALYGASLYALSLWPAVWVPGPTR